jgi:hypothetical protein
LTRVVGVFVRFRALLDNANIVLLLGE